MTDKAMAWLPSGEWLNNPGPVSLGEMTPGRVRSLKGRGKDWEWLGFPFLPARGQWGTEEASQQQPPNGRNEKE